MLWHAVANPSQTGEGRPRSTCVNTSNRGGPRDRRPGHPSDRTVRGTHRPGHPRTWPTPLRPRSSARGDRCRAGLPGRRPGAAALQRRTPLAAGRPHPGGAPVPPPAGPKRIQPAAQGPGAADGGRASVAGRQHPRFGRAAAAAGRYPSAVRPVHGHRVRPGQPQAVGRTRGGPATVARPAGQPSTRWQRRRHRQRHVRPADRNVLLRAGLDPGPPGTHRRARPRHLPQLAAPARGGDHLDVEASARPGSPRRPGALRPVGPHRAAPARPQRCDLAQLGHRRAGQALLDRLRSLTPPLTSREFPVNDLDEALEQHKQTLEVIEQAKQTATEVDQEMVDPQEMAALEVQVLLSIGELLGRRGDPDDALSYLTRGSQLARDLAEELFEGELLSASAEIHIDQGDVQKAIEVATAAIEIGKPRRNPPLLQNAYCILALAHLNNGDIPGGQPAARAAARYPRRRGRLEPFVLQGIVELLSGERERGFDAFNWVDQRARRLREQDLHNISVLDPHGLALCGLTLCSAGDYMQEATATFRQAREASSSQVGVAQRTSRLLDHMARADPTDLLNPARAAAAP